MAEAKEKRITEALEQRIKQLENDLKEEKNNRLAAESQHEETKKKMESLENEAIEVVRQWEKANTDLRGQLSSAKLELSELSTKLKESHESANILKAQVTQCESLSAARLAQMEEKQDRNSALENENNALSIKLTEMAANVQEMSLVVNDYERLTADMQHEVQVAFTAKEKYVQEIEELQSSLSKALAELSTTSTQQTTASSQVEKLTSDVGELKALNNKLCGELEIAQQCAKANTLELENMKMRSADTVARNDALIKEKAALEDANKQLCSEIEEMKLAAGRTEEELQNRVNNVSNLEKDVQELQDAAILQGKIIEEYQQQKEVLERELASAIELKNEADTQFSTVKELYSSALVEANESNSRSEEKYKSLRNEFEDYKAQSCEAVAASERRYEAAAASLENLTSFSQALQVRELLLSEQVARFELDILRGTEFVSVTSAAFHDVESLSIMLEGNLKRKQQEVMELGTENQHLAASLDEVKAKSASCEGELTNLRRSFAALESKTADFAATNKELDERNSALLHDNTWLKSQVEAMRTELGDLDGLLNANLNQMQEENEKHVADNHSLQCTVEELQKSEAALREKVSQDEQSFAALESEFAAQAKTLNLAEADLHALNADMEKLQGAFDRASAQLQDTEQRLTEATRSNGLLATQNNTLREQLRGQEEKLALIVADKRREIEGLRVKLNQYVEKFEEGDAAVATERKKREDVEKALAVSKETATKLRAAFDELKDRCSADADSLKQLIDERDELSRDRDNIVERYNRLHDTFRSLRKEANVKVTDELRKMLEFSDQQEKELQQLRCENITLKKSVSMFITSAQPQAEAIFMERLNLAEGPLRHPKKRSSTKNAE